MVHIWNGRLTKMFGIFIELLDQAKTFHQYCVKNLKIQLNFNISTNVINWQKEITYNFSNEEVTTEKRLSSSNITASTYLVFR